MFSIDFHLPQLDRIDKNIADIERLVKAETKEITMALTDLKTKLEQNTVTIEELTGDVQELSGHVATLQTTNEQLTATIEELKAQIPDNQLVAELESIAEQQATALRAAADVLPEPTPEPPVEPPVEPTEPPVVEPPVIEPPVDESDDNLLTRRRNKK
jgi:chromosome segregation ATPase